MKYLECEGNEVIGCTGCYGPCPGMTGCAGMSSATGDDDDDDSNDNGAFDAPSIINLTPHDIVVRGEDGIDTVFTPEESPARVSSIPGKRVIHSLCGAQVHSADETGPITDLPAARCRRYLIVSSFVAAAAKESERSTWDLLVPGTGPGDNPYRENGRIAAVRYLKMV